MKSSQNLAHFNRDLAERIFVQAFGDWALSVDVDARDARRVDSEDEVAKLVADTWVLRTRIEGPEDHDLFCPFPPIVVASLVAKARDLPPEATGSLLASGFGDADLAAFREMADLFCASATRALVDFPEPLRVSQSVDDLRILTPDQARAGLSSHVGGLGLLVTRLDVQVAEQASTVHLILPFRSAMRLRAACA